MAAKIGDAVRIVDREPTPADVKSGLYYSHFRNLSGTVERIYDDKTVCLNVEVADLPEDIRERHAEIAKEMRDKWLAGMSQEARARLTERDKQFLLSYKIVVAEADVEPAKGGAKKATARPPATAASPSEASAPPKAEAKTKKETPEAARPTSKDLEAAEVEYLEARRKDS